MIKHVFINFQTLENKYSEKVQKKLSKGCKDADLKIVFTSFKISNHFSNNDKTPYILKSFLVCRVVFARCSSSYIDKTCRHFTIRIGEHMKKTKNIIQTNIYTIMKSVSQVLVQTVFLFQITLHPTQFQIKIKGGYEY